METTRQQKVARQIQKDISEILLKECRELTAGTVTTVTLVRVSPDLSLAKVYFSVFPFDKCGQVLASLEGNKWMLRKLLGSRVRNQLKQVPELSFHEDDSMEYIDNIDKLLK